jgi:hypothetical protein
MIEQTSISGRLNRETAIPKPCKSLFLPPTQEHNAAKAMMTMGEKRRMKKAFFNGGFSPGMGGGVSMDVRGLEQLRRRISTLLLHWLSRPRKKPFFSRKLSALP